MMRQACRQKKHHPRMLGRRPLSRLFAQPAGAEPISYVERCTQRLRARYGRLSARIAISRQKRACCIKVKVSHCRSNIAYKGRPSAKSIAREFPFVVETMVPGGGLGRHLDDMHQFHRQCRITDQHIPRRRDDEHDYVRWCFKDLDTAQAFAAEFSGTLILPK